jgi:hypothetical protein
LTPPFVEIVMLPSLAPQVLALMTLKVNEIEVLAHMLETSLKWS